MQIPWDYLVLQYDGRIENSIAMIPHNPNQTSTANLWEAIKNKDINGVLGELKNHNQEDICVMNFTPPNSIERDTIDKLQQEIQHIFHYNLNPTPYHYEPHPPQEESKITKEILNSLNDEMHKLNSELISRSNHLLLVNTLHSLERQLRMQLSVAKFETRLKTDLENTLQKYMGIGLDDVDVWKKIRLGLHLAILHHWSREDQSLIFQKSDPNKAIETSDTTQTEIQYPIIEWKQVKLERETGGESTTDTVFINPPSDLKTIDWTGLDGTDMRKIILKMREMETTDKEMSIQQFIPPQVENDVWQRAEETVHDILKNIWTGFYEGVNQLEYIDAPPTDEAFSAFVLSVKENMQILSKTVHIQDRQIAFINTLNQLESDINTLLPQQDPSTDINTRKTILGLHLFIIYKWRDSRFFEDTLEREEQRNRDESVNKSKKTSKKTPKKKATGLRS